LLTFEMFVKNANCSNKIIILKEKFSLVSIGPAWGWTAYEWGPCKPAFVLPWKFLYFYFKQLFTLNYHVDNHDALNLSHGGKVSLSTIKYKIQKSAKNQSLYSWSATSISL